MRKGPGPDWARLGPVVLAIQTAGILHLAAPGRAATRRTSDACECVNVLSLGGMLASVLARLLCEYLLLHNNACCVCFSCHHFSKKGSKT
jgi:hypothetical protein